MRVIGWSGWSVVGWGGRRNLAVGRDARTGDRRAVHRGSIRRRPRDPAAPSLVSNFVSPAMTTPSCDPTPCCLIVDDEAPLRAVLRRILEQQGMRCRDAASGAEAVRLLEEEPVCLVLTDYHMPEMDGVQLLGVIRERWPDTAVVMVTAVSDVDLAVQCLGNGAMDYVTKPFRVEEIRGRVGQALEKRRLLLENTAYRQHLEERVQAQARAYEELFLASLQSLADALEVKDPYTWGHSLRVAQYAVAIARELGLDADRLAQIELGARLHDIGKIGVREAVLNKEGALTAEEYRHVMEHPVIGWRILSPLLRDAPFALDVVRSHHERFDGRGAPDGLAASQIPLEARIAAVADSFDAMTSGRPYRAGMAVDAALAELERCAGSQFDPDCVDAFARALEARTFPLPDSGVRRPTSRTALVA
jgi:response regulator RpfG family c-di-GMP phosphodiesterase